MSQSYIYEFDSELSNAVKTVKGDRRRSMIVTAA